MKNPSQGTQCVVQNLIRRKKVSPHSSRKQNQLSEDDYDVNSRITLEFNEGYRNGIVALSMTIEKPRPTGLAA